MIDEHDPALARRTATELLRDFRGGQIEPSRLLAATMEHIGRTNPAVNAIVTLNPEAEAEARESDRRYRGHGAIRPLEGIPFVVKDVIQTKGLKTTFGSKIHETHVPDEDAISVERMKAAGGVMVGKANTPEYAHDIFTNNKLFGPTRNPSNLAYTAGGSSGGTAGAVAAGMTPVGLGTDLGGSIRVPCAMCGIVGLRPSAGRVPVYPSDFGWDTLVSHVHGPMTRSVDDIGLLMSVLAGPDDRDPSSLPAQPIDYVGAASGKTSIARRRIAFSADLNGLVPIESEIAALCETAAKSFERVGASVTSACFDVSDLFTILAGTRGFGMVGRYSRILKAHREIMEAPLIAQIEDALKLDVQTVVDAERGRTGYYHRFRTFMQDYDYLVTPVLGATAWKIGVPLPMEIEGRKLNKAYDPYRFSYAFSILGVPVLAVPAGRTRSGMPVGLQIIGKRLSEQSLLEAGAAYMSMHADWVNDPMASPALQPA